MVGGRRGGGVLGEDAPEILAQPHKPRRQNVDPGEDRVGPVLRVGRKEEKSLSRGREIDGPAGGVGDDETGSVAFDQRRLSGIVYGQRVNEERLERPKATLLLGRPGSWPSERHILTPPRTRPPCLTMSRMKLGS